MTWFSSSPKERDVFLSKESGNDFPLDKKNRPLVCKLAGKLTSIFNAMSSLPGKGKIQVLQTDFEGNVQIKDNGSYLNVDDDFEIPNTFKKVKIGRYLGTFKNKQDEKEHRIE
jgi:hypothetical protein